MKRLRSKAVAATMILALGCGPKGPPPNVAPASTIEQLQQAGKKVDFAIAATKDMIQRSRGATYMPDMYMRLAELYSSRARYGWLALFEARKNRHEDTRGFDAPEARLLKNLAIGVYDRLLREFPKYVRADEAMFFMAHEYRELGEFDSMKSTYEKLIATYPKSPHRLEAYLVLGDAAFDKGRLDDAEKYYNYVLAEPAGKVTSLARYKLGWVRINKEDCKGATRLFEQILRDKSTPKGTQTIIATQRSVNISREALVDIAYCFPDVFPKDPPAPYFKSLASNSSDYIAAMRRAGGRFFIKQMYLQASAALREVLDAAGGDEEAVETARKLYDNIIKGRVFDNAPGDVRRIGRVYEERFYDFRVPLDSRNKLAIEFEVYARDIATKSQLLAKEHKTPQLFAIAAAAYNEYLTYFPTSTHAGDMRANLAETLLGGERHYDAARAYERIAALAPVGDAKKQAITNAVSEYQSALEQGGLNRVERVFARGGTRLMGRDFIETSPADAQILRVKMAIARSYYESGEYRRAAELFHALVRQYPQTEEGQISAQLALDALRLADDFEGIVTLGKRMLADTRLPAQLRSDIQNIVAKTEQRQIAEMTIMASGEDREEQLTQYAKRNKGNAAGEQALYNMLIVARDGGDSGKFYELGAQYIEDYPTSKKRMDVLKAMASTATDRGDFLQAATFLEQIYDAEPGARDSADRLQAAATIHAFMGDTKVAADVKRLAAGGNPGRIDELLDIIARSGNLSGLEDIVTQNQIDSPMADFLRGYFAYQRGDKDDAAKFLNEAARGRAQSAASTEAMAKAKFLLGELAYEQYDAAAATGDIAKTITEKQGLLGNVDKAFSAAIQSKEAVWVLAAIGRMSDAYQHYATFLQGLQLPDGLSSEEQQQLRKILAAKVEEAQKHGQEFNDLCIKRAYELTVFSDYTRACLTKQPLPDKVAMFPQALAKREGEPPAAAEIRAKLLKQPKDAALLTKLAELYLGSGDLGMALLVLDKAEESSGNNHSTPILTLRGVALMRAGDANGAYEAFKKAADYDSGNQLAHMNLAAHYATYGYDEKAKAELKKAGNFVPRGEPNEHPNISSLSRFSAPGEKK